MLYDPKWEVKSDPLSLASLIAWLETMPADEKYDYCDPFNCLVGQYLNHHGFLRIGRSAEELRQLGWYDIVHHIEESRERTFGAALKRARAALCVVCDLRDCIRSRP